MKKINFIVYLFLIRLIANAQCFDIVINDAVLTYKNGQYLEALEKLDRSANCPDVRNLELFAWRDSCRIRLKNQSQDLKELMFAFVSDSVTNIGEYYFNLAQSELTNCTFEEASKYFRYARLSPDLPPYLLNNISFGVVTADSLAILNNQAIEHYRHFEYDKAKQYYNKILLYLPDNPIIQNRINYCDHPVFSKNNFVSIKGGLFLMGDNDYWPEDNKRHTVTITDFSIYKYEITNAEYAEFLNIYGSDRVKNGFYQNQRMVQCEKYINPDSLEWYLIGNKNAILKEENTWRVYPENFNKPAIFVNWVGAKTFCDFWNLKLPSEAQWEYAARSCGKRKRFSWGNSEQNFILLKRSSNSVWVPWIGFYKPTGTDRVGWYRPNSIGLYDITGNVNEWCMDWYDKDFCNESGGTIDPVNTTFESMKSYRGGSWKDYSFNSETYNRKCSPKGNCTNDIGFRPVLLPEKEHK
jgi:sulfatase modifying factor 1